MAHVSRLVWSDSRGHGEAEHDEVRATLHQRPAVLLHVGTLRELVYAPGSGERYVRENDAGRRALQSGEATELLHWLRVWAAVSRDALSRPLGRWTAPSS